jgi:hypothetical protein
VPQPTTHIIDWFHIAVKIQPLQRIAWMFEPTPPLLKTA